MKRLVRKIIAMIVLIPLVVLMLPALLFSRPFVWAYNEVIGEEPPHA